MTARSITVRTMAPKGATQDLLLLHMREIMAAEGADLIVVNSSGRDGIDAAALALRDPPDGRHFLMTSAYAVNYYPAFSDVGYRREDFAPVLGVGAYNFVHVTAAANPWCDLGEVLRAVRAEGRALRFAGVGEVDLLLMKALAARAGVGVEFKQTGGPPLLAAVLAREVDVGLGTGTHQPLLKEGKVRVMTQLHPRAVRGNGAPPTPRDLGVDVVQENFAMLSIRRDADPAAAAESLAELARVLRAPSAEALIADRLLMVPGLLEGAALDAALAAQREVFVKLRAAVG
ncbi:MAG: tripartite tricarboxylate transporter substrate-binding protein [Alphaproteobacteria bacterium]